MKRLLLLLFLSTFLTVSCSYNTPELTRPPGVELSPQVSNTAESVSNTDEPVESNTIKREISVYYSSYTKEAFDYIKNEFVKSHPDIAVTSRCFDDQWDFYEHFNTRLMAGTDVPDVVLMHSYGDKNVFYSRGNLFDLYEFMNDDPGFDCGDYYTNAFKAFEDGGKLFAFPVRFSYAFAAVNESLTGMAVSDFRSRDHISHSDMVKLYNSFAEETDKGFELNNDTAYNLIYLKRAVYERFVDIKNKTCDFLNDEFINLLKEYERTFISGEFTPAELQPNGILYEDDTKQAALKAFTIDFFMQQYRFQYFLDYDKSNFVHAIPITDDDGRPLLTYAELAFIPSQAKEKDAAWEFLKFLTIGAADNQFAFVSMFYDFIPINKARFEDVFNYRIALFLNDSKYTDFDLKPLTADGMLSYGKGFNGDEETEVSRVFNEINKWNGAEMSPAPYFECMQIIDSAIRAFRIGEQTAEQTAKELQNKVNLWLNE